MMRFLHDPESCLGRASTLIPQLVYGWGNEDWSGRPDFLSGCVAHALRSGGPILECGTGLSTLLVGAVAERRGHVHWALEHMPEWAGKVQEHAHSYGIATLGLCRRPLRDYGEYCWYDGPFEAMPERFSLIICDGPPADTKGGRYGLLPVMKDRLTAGTVILLDDAERDAERKVAKRWQAELGASCRVVGSASPYFELQIGSGGDR